MFFEILCLFSKFALQNQFSIFFLSSLENSIYLENITQYMLCFTFKSCGNIRNKDCLQCNFFFIISIICLSSGNIISIAIGKSCILLYLMNIGKNVRFKIFRAEPRLIGGNDSRQEREGREEQRKRPWSYVSCVKMLKSQRSAIGSFLAFSL